MRMLFREMTKTGEIKCSTPGHKGCNIQYKVWKKRHPQQHRNVVDRAGNSPRSTFIPQPATLNVYGRHVKIEGGIMSIVPPCLGVADANGNHPYTCKNCSKQLRDLKDHLRKKKKAVYGETDNRIGRVGFRASYSRVNEQKQALEKEKINRKRAEKLTSSLLNVVRTHKEWEEVLGESVENQDDVKFILDLVGLFKGNIAKNHPVQLTVMKNLVGKLKSKNNHKYLDIVKDISTLHKNRLGERNYSILADIFGLCGKTTASSHGGSEKLYPGLNEAALEKACDVYSDMPVIECSDEARALRYLEARKSIDGGVELVGRCFDPSVENWVNQTLQIPKTGENGAPDDFSALKHLVEDLVNKDLLSKSVSVHHFSSLTSVSVPNVVHCLWPTPNKGYKSVHLLKYLENLRRLTVFKPNGCVRKKPLNLMGFSTDSAGFSLAASVISMTPSESQVEAGIYFLRLGVDDEKFAAPYYFKLPFIAYLDYEHERRLFAKCLKYPTLDLTFWKDSSICIATIDHLKALREKCKDEGVVCGFTVHDLLLASFFDQNPDASDRLFTIQTADLLDKYVSSSQGTSLFIRAVFFLTEPFRNVNFGTPAEVQTSLSAGITIFRHWKRLVELQGRRLRSKAGAKTNPENRGHFLTYGCEQTAEILFAAGTLHNLALFLHFGELGPRWSSPYCSGTKSTERIIGELQGKTVQMQSLNSQPTFGEMLDKAASVQFNQGAEKKLALSGVKVKPTTARKKLAFAFQTPSDGSNEGYRYPDSFLEYQNEQKKAHREGILLGLSQLEKYLPLAAVDCLKKAGAWGKPFTFNMPEGMIVVGEGGLPAGYDKLDFSFSDSMQLRQQLKTIEEECSVDNEEHKKCEALPVESGDGNDEQSNVKIERSELFETVDDDDECIDKKASKEWYISRVERDCVTKVHVSRAIKMLLPREFISRNRSQRHIASNYLPGKSPMDPNHDIVKFSDVAIKSSKEKKKGFKIGRIVSLQEKGGSDILSTTSKKGKEFRCRCSLYEQNGNVVSVPSDVLVTDWISGSSILGPVKLSKTDRDGVYEVASESLECLTKMGYLPLSDMVNINCLEESGGEDEVVSDEKQDLLSHGFFEVDDIVGTRINAKTHEFEYRVRFSGYTESDDAWLPASSFNRPVDFASSSRYGRKRFHKTNVDEASNPLSGSVKLGKDESAKRNPKGKKVKQPQKTKRTSKPKKKSNVISADDVIKHDTNVTQADEAKHTPTIISGASKSPGQKLPLNKLSSLTYDSDDGNSVPLVTTTDAALLRSDLLQSSGRFCSPRMAIASYHTPPVRRCTTFSLFPLNAGNGSLADPFAVNWLPPERVINDASKSLFSKKKPESHVVEFNGLGKFSAQSLRVLQNYFAFKSIATKATFEEKWLQEDTQRVSLKEKMHLLNTVLYLPPKNGGLIAKRNGIEIFVDDLTTLCGERYLNDKIIDFLFNLIDERANSNAGKTICLSLSTFLSPEQLGEGAMKMLHRVTLTHDISSLEIIMLPCIIERNHWGLIIFDLTSQRLLYDDGFHLHPPPIYLRSCVKVLQTIFENSNCERFNVTKWKPLSLESFGMPDQPHSGTGSASCGIGVLLAATDYSNGVKDFGWTFEEAPQYRKRFMLDVIHNKP